MTHVEHIAIWVDDLEAVSAFYSKYFNASVGPKYENEASDFSSRFLYFSTGARIELMNVSTQAADHSDRRPASSGFAHLAVSVGSDEHVEELTEELRRDGHAVVGDPRHTGDGYYESIVLDPEGNRIEITA
jgi:lactoylglutathione lyase